MRACDPERVEEPDGLRDPGLRRVGDALGTIGEAEADHVGRDDAIGLGQRENGQPPVRPGADAGTRPVDEQHRLTLAPVVVIDADAGDFEAISGLASVTSALLVLISDITHKCR